MTARDVKFSDAISSIPSFCRAVSAATMRAISGSTSASDRFRSAAGRTAASGMDPPGSGSYRGGGDRAQEKRLFRVVRGDLGVEALQRHVPQVRDAREIAIPEEHVIRKEPRVLVPRRQQR